MVEELRRPPSEEDLHDLARLLIDAVDSGAAVTFLPPLAFDRAVSWWRTVLERGVADGVCLVARQDGRIVGTVHYHRAGAPNQPHRADVAKLVVHREARGRGLGSELMQALEQRARSEGLRLLTLDTKRGDVAERLYTRLGWRVAGIIPEYALNPDGTYHDTVIFFKTLDDSGASRDG